MITYFYFDLERQNLSNLLSYLLLQLSAQSNPCYDILSQLYSKYDRLRKPSDHDMVECLKKMLLLEAQAPTYIVIDALDGCPIKSIDPGSSPRDEVLELVDELVGLHLPNLHI